jgi:hypothetical protein
MPPEDSSARGCSSTTRRGHKLDAAQFWKGVRQGGLREAQGRDEGQRRGQAAAAEAVGDAATPDAEARAPLRVLPHEDQERQRRRLGHDRDEREKTEGEQVARRHAQARRGHGATSTCSSPRSPRRRLRGAHRNLADRSDTFFDPASRTLLHQHVYDIAVKVGDEWRFYDPASTYVPFGMLRWQEEGQQALISDPKEPFFVQTPLSGPEKSSRSARPSSSSRRTARSKAT